MKKAVLVFLLLAALTVAGCSRQTPAADSTTSSWVPEAGTYLSEYDEMLTIEENQDGTYGIEYGITHLLYVEDALGAYDASSGILHFAGTDDFGDPIEADIQPSGDGLLVTVTKSSHPDAQGTSQMFYPSADAP